MGCSASLILGTSLKMTKPDRRDRVFLPALPNLPFSLVTPHHGQTDGVPWGNWPLLPSICGDQGNLLGLVNPRRYLHILGAPRARAWCMWAWITDQAQARGTLFHLQMGKLRFRQMPLGSQVAMLQCEDAVWALL